MRMLSGDVLHMISASSISCSRPSDWKDRLTPGGKGRGRRERGREAEVKTCGREEEGVCECVDMEKSQ